MSTLQENLYAPCTHVFSCHIVYKGSQHFRTLIHNMTAFLRPVNRLGCSFCTLLFYICTTSLQPMEHIQAKLQLDDICAGVCM